MASNLTIHKEDYFPHQWAFLTSKKKINAYVGGFGSGKTYSFLHKTFINHITSSLSTIENKIVENILGFFRVSNENLDTDWRIHSDLNIEGQQPDRALVLYISPRKINELHGTALWEHKIYHINLVIPYKPLHCAF